MSMPPLTLKMRARRLALAVVPALLLGAAGQALAQGAETAAATVNGVAIPQAKLQSSLDAYMRRNQVGAGGVFDPGFYNNLRKRVLDVLIAQELLWQEAKARGMAASDEETKAAMEQMRTQLGSESAFSTTLRQSGFDDEAAFAEDLKRRLSVQKLVAADIAPSIQVSDAEVHEFYSANAERFVQPEQIQARHILVKVPKDADEATREAARERIDAIHAEAKGGADFAELAKQRSEGPTAPKGGDLGFFGRGQMVKPFEEAAFGLEPGAVSEPVQTGFGYHVIKVEERRGGEAISEEAVAARIRDYLTRTKVQQAVAARAEALRQAAEVQIGAES
ncbi:MAG: peptidylprolyl isomerase [Gammaproteobacteria bacterium]|nr:peptidylprolyl isomerase [Gammaproteobacteria bacterium]